jgi:serine phosphatase RsbU (regulator of sigma subunit)
VLAMPDGTARVLRLPAGQSLGVGPAVYGQARIRLPPSAVLALYTDGLAETRTRPFEQGILALQSVLGRAVRQLGTVCDKIIAACGDHHEDDVTIVLAKLPSSPVS